MWTAPQSMAMTAKVVNAAAVRPAATSRPPLWVAEAISAIAATPSDSVETPTRAVRAPQMKKRMPTKSTWDAIIEREESLFEEPGAFGRAIRPHIPVTRWVALLAD